MKKLPVIAIYDVGKTNKKLLLFDDSYKLVYEDIKQLDETTDEDGFICEDVHALTHWVSDSFGRLLKDERFAVNAVNFAAYGASFVYLDEGKNVIPPLYNYLKPFSSHLQKQFFDTYGSQVTRETASPVLGSLNSGMQLYGLKYKNPRKFAHIKYALHLPQYLSFILTNRVYSEITSTGCHTCLWDFEQNNYHRWVSKEGILEKLPVMVNAAEIAGYTHGKIPVGTGLHDSSAALIPYLFSFNKPFILLSTGTWCISLNAFNNLPLSDDELRRDCLCYLSYEGKAVKASRIFAGFEHEEQIKRLAQYFNKPADYYSSVTYNPEILNKLIAPGKMISKNDQAMIGHSYFAMKDLSTFVNYEEAYHQLLAEIIEQQVRSTSLILEDTAVKRIFVDGGFSKNSIYMNLLASVFPGFEVYAAAAPQASALGAAIVTHRQWNRKSLPPDIVDLKFYSVADKFPMA